MAQFLQKYMTNGMISISILLNFRSLMAMSLNLLALPELFRTLVYSIVETNSYPTCSLSIAVGIINSAKHFPNFSTVDGKNIMPVWKNFYNKVFLIQISIEIWYINFRKTSRVGSENHLREVPIHVKSLIVTS